MPNTIDLQLVPGWAKLPENVELGYTHGVAVDSQNRLIVFNMSRHAVAFFDPSGQFLHSWGSEFAAGAHGLHLRQEEDGQEFLYLTDYARHLVAKYTLDGQEVLTIGVPPVPELYPNPESYMPTDVDVAPNGDIYVADGYGQYAVHRFDRTGKWLQCWGGKNEAGLKFHEPHGIGIDSRSGEPVLYVADRRHQRFVAYRLDGEFIATYEGDYRLPCDVVPFGENGFIFPDLNGRITITDSNFQSIAHIGDNPNIWEDSRWPNLPPQELVDGKFNSPHGLCVHGNQVFVAEWVQQGRITKWEVSGK
ncbi:hypothetical protein M3223_15250 [Paenibacillus pasadenensis]|uniref:hypothetical protein n=1 Tax=Paenibacillus pasadenensis TaxID=217090 RepID=UPI00203D275B|nr:hypothetical protein [Paenibacillus pasadenensis]MCM3748707.1 hypothetical protein [Paenibacillus pasadenensis]